MSNPQQPSSIPPVGSANLPPLQTTHLTPPSVPTILDNQNRAAANPIGLPTMQPNLGQGMPQASAQGTIPPPGMMPPQAAFQPGPQDVYGQPREAVQGSTWVWAVVTHVVGLIMSLVAIRWGAESIRLIRSAVYGEPLMDYLYIGLLVFGGIALTASLIVSIIAAFKRQKTVMMIINIVLLVVLTPLWSTIALADGAQRIYANTQQDVVEATKNISLEDARKLYAVLVDWGLVSSEAELKEQYGIDLEALEQQGNGNGALELSDLLNPDTLKLIGSITGLDKELTPELWNKIANDADLQKQITDPELLKAIENGDMEALLQNPELLKTVTDLIKTYSE